MDKPILIGQAPNRTMKDPRPLIGGRTGGLLMALAGYADNEPGYLRAFDRVNLLSEWPGANGGKGDRFPAAAARRAADSMAPDLAGRRVILVGRGVCRAFGLRDLPWFEWLEDPRGFRVAAIPHTSPINSFWNPTANRAEACRFFHRVREES